MTDTTHPVSGHPVSPRGAYRRRARPFGPLAQAGHKVIVGLLRAVVPARQVD